MPVPRPDLPVGEPFCGNCGYRLSGLTDASRCPECGKPLVEVLARNAGFGARPAVRYKSDATVFGWPLLCISKGARPEFGEFKGVAKGVIAIGDVAVGGVALGGAAFGAVALGGCAIGLCTLGGASIGLLTAVGGGAIGGIAVGGGALGGFATGGGAVGIVAQGGGAVGVYARGGGAFGLHTIDMRGSDPVAVEAFRTLRPIMGPPVRAGRPTAEVLLPVVCVDMAVLFLMMLLVIVGKRSPRDDPFAAAGPRGGTTI